METDASQVTKIDVQCFVAHPIFLYYSHCRWSADGKFFARMTADTLSIYETPSFGLLEKKSLRILGIK